MFLLIFLLIMLMAGSFIFSGSETAFFSLSEREIKRLIREKHPLSRILKDLSRNKTPFLSSLLFFNTLTNIAFASLSYLFFERMGIGGNEYILLKVLAITLILLMFCEITPKALALAKRDSFIYLLIPSYMLFLVSYPLMSAFGKIFKHERANRKSKFKSEMKDVLSYLKENESHVRDEVEFLEKYNQLKHKEIYSICVKREGIIYLKSTATLVQAGALFKKYRLSRIPIVIEDVDTIVGIFHIKDMIHLSGDAGMKDILRKAHKIDYRTPVFKVMNYFLKNKTHIAILVDSLGKTLGLVTLQDIVDDIIKPLQEDE